MFALLRLLFSKILFLDAGQYCTGRTDTVDFLKYIVKQKNAIYIWDICNFRVMEAYDPLEKIDKDLMTNSTYDSVWPSNMPFFQKRNREYLDRYNLYEGLINSDNVYLFGSNNIELKREYIESHYGDNISYSLVESPYGFEIYSINAFLNSEKSEDIKWDILICLTRIKNILIK